MCVCLLLHTFISALKPKGQVFIFYLIVFHWSSYPTLSRKFPKMSDYSFNPPFWELQYFSTLFYPSINLKLYLKHSELNNNNHVICLLSACTAVISHLSLWPGLEMLFPFCSFSSPLFLLCLSRPASCGVSDSFCGPVSIAQHLPHQAPFPTEPSVAGLFRGTEGSAAHPATDLFCYSVEKVAALSSLFNCSVKTTFKLHLTFGTSIQTTFELKQYIFLNGSFNVFYGQGFNVYRF